MAGAAGIRSLNNDNAEKLINISNISKIFYSYVYLRRIGSVYDALLG
jgi:hypothetical protein